jgi:hypothetical protein
MSYPTYQTLETLYTNLKQDYQSANLSSSVKLESKEGQEQLEKLGALFDKWFNRENTKVVKFELQLNDNTWLNVEGLPTWAEKRWKCGRIFFRTLSETGQNKEFDLPEEAKENIGVFILEHLDPTSLDSGPVVDAHALYDLLADIGGDENDELDVESNQ